MSNMINIKTSFVIKSVSEATKNILDIWENIKNKVALILNEQGTLKQPDFKFQFYTGDVNINTNCKHQWIYKKSPQVKYWSLK